jgi:hypothetical protein
VVPVDGRQVEPVGAVPDERRALLYVPKMHLRHAVRRLCVAAIAGFTAACGAASRSTPATTAPHPATVAAARIPGYNLRVVLDSGELEIETTSRASAVTVISPAGTFLEAFEENTPFVAWADSMERLLPNATAGPGAPANDTIANVPAPIDPKYPTHFWVERTGGGSSPNYVLGGTNGAWGFGLALDSAQLEAVAAALRGQTTNGVLTFDWPRQGKTPAEAKPAVTGAWMKLQVDESAATLGGPIVFRFPSGFRGHGNSVNLGFIIDSTGFVRTSSIKLIGNPPPELALAAREQLAAIRFRPAMRGGRAVPQMVGQEFSFRW